MTKSAPEELKRDLSLNHGVIRLRLSAGVFRNLMWVQDYRRRNPGVSNDRVEEALGLSPGWLGDYGIGGLEGRFGRNLSALHSQVGRNEVFLVTSGHADSSIEGESITHRARCADEPANAWRHSVVEGSFAAMADILRGRRVVFLGAPRTRRLAMLLGVNHSDLVTIPDDGAYELVPELVSECLKRLEAQSSSQLPVILHVSSLAGHNVLLQLADLGYEFVGVDLGLAGTILDAEYLATRGWYKQNAYAITRTALVITQSAVKGAVPIGMNRRILEVRAKRQASQTLAAGERWIRALRAQPVNTRIAIQQLDWTLSYRRWKRFPIMASINLLWSYWELGTWNENLLWRLASSSSKPEPALVAACLFSIRGSRREAMRALEVGRRISPLDPRNRRWMGLVKSAESADVGAWLNLVSLPSRAHLGSALSWSLHGDLPNVDPLAHR